MEREDVEVPVVEAGLSKHLTALPARPAVTEMLVSQMMSFIQETGLGPNDKLPSESEFVAATGASRASVREALRVLKTIGIVETRPGAGSFITSVKPVTLLRTDLVSYILMGEDVFNILEARKALECEAAGLAAQRGSPEDFAGLEHILEQIGSNIMRGLAVYDITWAFHIAIADIAGNPVMAKLIRILYGMVHDIQLRVYYPNVDAMNELAGHTDLYEAICSQSAERAKYAMNKHLDEVAAVVKQALAEASARAVLP